MFTDDVMAATNTNGTRSASYLLQLLHCQLCCHLLELAVNQTRRNQTRRTDPTDPHTHTPRQDCHRGNRLASITRAVAHAQERTVRREEEPKRRLWYTGGGACGRVQEPRATANRDRLRGHSHGVLVDNLNLDVGRLWRGGPLLRGLKAEYGHRPSQMTTDEHDDKTSTKKSARIGR